MHRDIGGQRQILPKDLHSFCTYRRRPRLVSRQLVGAVFYGLAVKTRGEYSDIGMNTREALVKAKREEILRIAAAHGARRVRLFGSTVRGESTGTSDIDLLVDLEPGRSLLDHAAMIVELEKALGCRVDVVPERGLRSRIRDAVLRDAVPL